MVSSGNPDLLLLSCPSKVIDYPCLSLPALTGFLKKHNVNVLQKDLNMDIKDKLLSRENLSHLYKVVIPLLLRLNVNCLENYTKLKEFYSLLKKVDDSCGFEELEEIKKRCQKREYGLLNNKPSLETLGLIFEISKLCDFFFSFIYIYFPLFEGNGILLFLIEYLKLAVRKIAEVRPRAVGLTMITTQNNFTLWFADYLKSTGGFSGVIFLGGAQPTKFGEQYLKDNPAVDFVIVGEGEYPTLQLIRELKKEECRFNKIPRLIYRSKGGIIKNRNRKYLNEHYEAAFSDYEGFPLNKYLSAVLPILASSNCPWKKCKFCAHRTSFREDYHERNAKNVVDEMEYMYRRYGTRLFHFADETISAEQGADIGREIERRGLPFYWMSFGRLDDEFNEDYINQWYKGGARVIEWGLESASDEVLTRMNKGITVGKAQEIIHISGSLGIKNKLLTWHNYPGETLKDLLMTINFVKKNVKEGFAAPMLTLKQKLVLQVGSELYSGIFEGKDNEELFEKVWLPKSLYSINASYNNSNDHPKEKLALILPYIKEMKEYCSRNNIFIASNENISFDLILCQLKEG